MQIVQSLRQVTTKLFNRLLRKFFVLLDQLVQIAAGAVLKDDPEMVSRLIPVVKFEDVSVLETVEDAHLVQHFLASVFLDRLDSDIVDRLFLATLYIKNLNYQFKY